MCIAIVKLKFAQISDEYLENCFDHNKDGAGIAWSNGGKLYYIKGIFDKKAFISNVRRAERLADGAMLIHCRIGTHGLKDKDNCHPHVVNPKTVLIHNGILNVPVDRDSKISDTIYFIRKYLKPLPYDFMRDDAICALIEKSIGTANKFAMLNEKGEYRIINEQAGHWEHGVWYSNHSYETPSYAKFAQEDCMYWENRKQLPLFASKKDEEEDDEEAKAKEELTDKLVNNIRTLSNNDIINMGVYPMVDLKNTKLVAETEARIGNNTRYMYLDDVCEDAYEEYMYEIELRGLVNEVADYEELDKAG